MRTPMGCCASTFQRAPTSARTAPKTLRPWRSPSTAGRERPLAGGHRPRLWTSSFDRVTEAVLRRPLESTQDPLIQARGNCRSQTRRGLRRRAHPDALGLIVLGAMQRQGENAVRQLRLDPLRIHLERQAEGSPKGTAPALATMV